MRIWIAALPLLSLAACGGGTGAESVGSTAPPAPGGTPTPTPTDIYSQFTNPVEAQTYVGIGGTQVFEYLTDSRVGAGQQAQVYSGNASTVRDSAISISYDPRDAVFTLTISDPLSGADTGVRFQDPASRTDFGGATEPQWGTPDLSDLPAGAPGNPDIQYLQAGDGDPRSPFSHGGTGVIDPGDNDTPASGEPGSSYVSTTLFYEKPGSSTKYVTFAGYLRNSLSFASLEVGGQTVDTTQWHLERGVFAYGAQTTNSAVPTSGSGTFEGSMLGTMVYNPTFDEPGGELPTYFQWLSGTSEVTVDFGARTVDLAVEGVVLDPQIDRYTQPQTSMIAGGARFSGSGTATIDLVNTGGFTGAIDSFTFQDGATTTTVNVAGSSVDGAFFGPNAEEVGGGFRVVGGIPDQRVDIMGAFTGKQ